MKNYIVVIVILILMAIIILKRKPLMETAKTVVDKLLNRSEFIDKYKDIVKRAAKGSGLFPSLFMAQAILESSDSKGNPGNSGLAKNHKNFFGIKASKGWTGKVANLKTREVIGGKEVYVIAPFRKYDTEEQSFKDRVAFLQKNKNYTKAGVFAAKSPEKQAAALKAAGYATDPNYAKVLTNIIDKYSLKSLDVL